MSSLSAFLSFDDAVGHEEEKGLAIPAKATAKSPTSGSSSLSSSLSASPSLKLRQMGQLVGTPGADVHAKPATTGAPAWDTTREGSIWDEVIRSQEHMKRSASKGFEVVPPHFGEPNSAEAAVQTSVGSPEQQRFLSSDPPPKSNKKDNLAQFESGGADLHKRSWPAKDYGAKRWDTTQSGSIWDEIIKSQQYMKKA